MTRCMWCSTSSTVTWRSSRMRRISPPSSATSLVSRARRPARRAAAASGRAASARASSTRLRVPSGRPAAGRSATSRRSSMSSSAQAVSVSAASWRRVAGQAQRVGQEIAAAARMPADPHVVEHALRAEQRQVLEGARDADLGDAMRRPRQQRAPGEQDVAPVRRVEAADAIEQRRLAGAVRTDQAEDLALVQRERDAVERDDAAEPQRDVANLEQRAGVTGERRAARGRRISNHHGAAYGSRTGDEFALAPYNLCGPIISLNGGIAASVPARGQQVNGRQVDGRATPAYRRGSTNCRKSAIITAR